MEAWDGSILVGVRWWPSPRCLPREARGRRYSLPAILALATAAMLAGARSLYDIAQGGRRQEPAVVRALGFPRGRTPCVATLHLLFKDLDVRRARRPCSTGRRGNLAMGRRPSPSTARGSRASTARNCLGCGWWPLMQPRLAWCWRKREEGKRKAEYLVVVKANQPSLYRDIALLFEEPPPGEIVATAEQRGSMATARKYGG